jgi:hypothetical protein
LVGVHHLATELFELADKLDQMMDEGVGKGISSLSECGEVKSYTIEDEGGASMYQPFIH